MRMYDLIDKKKHSRELSKDEIQWFIDGYVNGEIPDYQVSALMMAIYFQGMTDEETRNLTMSMARSGDMLDLSPIEGVKVDKHSTGGVGDKTSLVVAPLVASLGVPVAKMSGKGLGHTGGTIDKLESIPGFSTSIATDDFFDIVNNSKMSIVGQTANLAPADKKLYGLRDVTATVDQKALIASSIMSKKIASGADAIVLDVKTGSGAFMKDFDDALELAKLMVSIGNGLGRDTTAIISNMNQPLGNYVGNSLEVIEAIDTLKGKGPIDLVELCLTLGSHMVYHGNAVDSIEEGYRELKKALDDGRGLEMFRTFIAAQGGNPHVIEEYDLLPSASCIEAVLAHKTGYIKGIQADEIGYATMMLGGGREKKTDTIDYGVGYVMERKVGDHVEEGEILGHMYINDKKNLEAAKKRILDAYDFSSEEVESSPIILEVIED